MDTYTKLLSGELRGATRLTLSCGVDTFPRAIFDLADTLEVLDLSRNRLEALPDDFGRLKKLRILFLSSNNFKEIPSVLSQCPELSMVGFKSNQIKDIGENSLPPKIRWLILTDNQIEQLPDSIGDLGSLQKLMLAGNRLKTLPDSMQRCTNLELIRLSANRFDSFPRWLFTLPRLSWLACAGNPIQTPSGSAESLKKIVWEDIRVGKILGEGASGVISQAVIGEETHCAMKVFKGEVTSDGYPADEMSASMSAGKHTNLNTPYAKIANHPQGKEALIFELIPPAYRNLGNPPDFQTCTRDTFEANQTFTLDDIAAVALGIANAAHHLHQKGICHGDLYAHNILINPESHAMLGDFGAATLYDRSDFGEDFERLEVRAFGCLLEDMLHRSLIADETQRTLFESLHRLKEEALSPVIEQRPLFGKIVNILEGS